MRLGQSEDARRALETALAQSPVFPAAHKRLARLLSRAGDEVASREHWQLARVAGQRIERFRAGEAPPDARAARAATSEAASLGTLGEPKTLPPLGKDEIVIVSGLPRSGTSMMMQMLAAGGLPLLTDERRAADESNPRGYYELEAVKALGAGHGWLSQARGKAVKIVAPLLPHLPAGQRLRVIFMERPLAEVVASQRAMLDRLGKTGAETSHARLAGTFLQQVARVRRLLGHYAGEIHCLSVSYAQALEDPVLIATRVGNFLGMTLDSVSMTQAVEPSLRNQRAAGAS